VSDAAVANESDPDLRDEFRSIEEHIDELRQEVAGLREGLRDCDDSGTATRLIEGQEAVIETLERRRLELLERLGQA